MNINSVAQPAEFEYYHSSVQRSRNYSGFVRTVMAAALGVFAFIAVSVPSPLDYTNPTLALALRFSVGGLGLLWLLKRCFPSQSRSIFRGQVLRSVSQVQEHPPVAHTTYFQGLRNWFESSQAPFPPVVPAPAQIYVPAHPSDHSVMHALPTHRGSPPQQARTNYSAASHAGSSLMHEVPKHREPNHNSRLVSDSMHPVATDRSSTHQQARTNYSAASHAGSNAGPRDSLFPIREVSQ